MLEVINYKVDLKFKSLLQIYGRTSRDKKKEIESKVFYSHVYHELCYFISFLIILQYKKINTQEAFLRSPSLSS